MKKITLFALILLSFVVVFWSCTKEEISEPAATNIEELAEQLAKDEEFIKLQKIFVEYSDLRLKICYNLTKSEREQLLLDLKERTINHKFSTPLTEHYLGITKSEETFRSMTKLFKSIRVRFPQHKNLSKTEYRQLFSISFKKCQQKNYPHDKARTEYFVSECYIDYQDCRTVVFDDSAAAANDCLTMFPDPEERQVADDCISHVWNQRSYALMLCEMGYFYCMDSTRW